MNPSMKLTLLIALALGCWAQTVPPRDVPPKLVKHTVILGELYTWLHSPEARAAWGLPSRQ